MTYRKRYSIKNLQDTFLKLSASNKTYISLDDILDEIGFEPLDIQEYYVKNIKHRFRYEKNYKEVM